MTMTVFAFGGHYVLPVYPGAGTTIATGIDRWATVKSFVMYGVAKRH